MQVTLYFVASHVREQLMLLDLFNPFCDDSHAQAACQSNDGVGNGLVFHICAKVTHKRLVNFEHIQRKSLEVRQA